MRERGALVPEGTRVRRRRRRRWFGHTSCGRQARALRHRPLVARHRRRPTQSRRRLTTSRRSILPGRHPPTRPHTPDSRKMLGLVDPPAQPLQFRLELADPLLGSRKLGERALQRCLVAVGELDL